MFELSLDEPLTNAEVEEITRLHRIEAKKADQDYQEGCADRNEERTLAEIAEGMKYLTPVERRVIQLSFEKGLTRKAIAKRIGLSVPRVNCLQRQGVPRLRTHLAARGYTALPETTPIPNDGGFERGSASPTPKNVQITPIKSTT